MATIEPTARAAFGGASITAASEPNAAATKGSTARSAAPGGRDDHDNVLGACCGAHHMGRLFAAHGHDVRLMSPEYVRPYVKAQKNDDRDAEGIAEAATRPRCGLSN